MQIGKTRYVDRCPHEFTLQGPQNTKTQKHSPQGTGELGQNTKTQKHKNTKTQNTRPAGEAKHTKTQSTKTQGGGKPVTRVHHSLSAALSAAFGRVVGCASSMFACMRP